MSVAADLGLSIRGRSVGPQGALYVVAEVGLNHGGDPTKAAAMIDAAADAGVAAVKLQSLRAHALVSVDCPAPAHVQATSLRAFFARFELDAEAHRDLATRAHRSGVAFISTPFDEASADMLVDIGADALKIASGDITHRRLIAHVSRAGLPVMLSTGMSTLQEVQQAVRCARDHGAAALAVLHCVSAYPTPHGAENLRAVATLARAFDVPVGLSDHSREPLAVPLAIALGASIYERHVVLEGDQDAVDRAVSSTPADLKQIVDRAAYTQRILGHGRRECSEAERPNRGPSRRGVYAARTIPAGSVVTPADVVVLRPENRCPADAWDLVIGARTRCDIPEGAPLSPEAIEGTNW